MDGGEREKLRNSRAELTVPLSSIQPQPQPSSAEHRKWRIIDPWCLLIYSQSPIQLDISLFAELIKRLRVLTLTLLPLEGITPQVISAYIAAAGDLIEALPYCLLRARRDFMLEANRNAADYGENCGRAIACEVLARRIVHQSPVDRIPAILSSRYKHRQSDGDIEYTSAIELAIDSHCTIFLSSSEAQDVINYLWTGDLVQINNGDHDVDYVPAYDHVDPSFWGHFDPCRIAVPRYQNVLRVIIWLFFLVVYSQAVREPLDRLDPLYQHLDFWEVMLYIYKTLRFATWRAFGFWHLVASITDALLLAAFILRVSSLASQEGQRDQLRLRSFQVLSFVSPLIWCLITVFDGYKYIGTVQICVARMIRESGIFFSLLSILGIGFLQGLYALDAADGQVESSSAVMHLMVQSLLQSPNYDKFSTGSAGQTLYYFWNVVTAIVLLNVLISLFSSAYSDVVDDAEAEYLAFFASKTVAMIRAPDTYLYPAPFNLVEILFVGPLEFVLSPSIYAKLNRSIMTVLFFIPMTIIALHESTSSRDGWLNDFISGPSLEDDDSPAARDPEVDGEDAGNGLAISKVPFSELVKAFPNTHESSETSIIREVQQVKAQLDALIRSLDARKS
ncbi:calcium activated cation channel [Multifurca ochricompacta]|uniref:Calcium activated cation channel n=1 Tax=Multifurca ochricompacta TaxID=376703 RepID=A0AAD4QPM3_9AGAM|nr:calcium activated cation channel [Multifurca ochricompacta]